MTEPSTSQFPRYTGDRVAIEGEYQYRVLNHGPAPQRFWHEAKLREAEKWLAPRAGQVLLDVGCGSGVLAARLARHEGVKVIGVDGNRSAWAFATGQWKLPNLDFRLGLVDELDIPDNSIDGIAFLEVIEHVNEAQGLAVLKTFGRILKPGGRAVISTPNYRSLWPVIEWMLDKTKLVPPMAEHQHVTFYHRRTLRALGEQAGLRYVTHRTICFAAPWLALLHWRLAEAAHRCETARPQPLGSVIVMVFEKPDNC